MDFKAFAYWGVMGAVVGVVKGIEAYRRPETKGDTLLALADGLTAVVVWRLSSALMIGAWAALHWAYKLPEVSEETFTALGMVIGLYGLRATMAVAMRIPFLRP
jgi:hypothetical protein